MDVWDLISFQYTCNLVIEMFYTWNCNHVNWPDVSSPEVIFLEVTGITKTISSTEYIPSVVGFTNVSSAQN